MPPSLVWLLLAVRIAAGAEETDGQCAIQVGRNTPHASSTGAEDTDFIKILALGDYGIPSSMQSTVAESMDRLSRDLKPAAVLALGDNVYEYGAGSHEEIVSKVQRPMMQDKPALHIPWYVCAGNHDWRQNPMTEVTFTNSSLNLGYWQFPQLWYKKSLHACKTSVDFFIIDTMIWRKGAHTQKYLGVDPQALYAQQAEWLAQELRKSTADWKVVAGHHPLYTTGCHESSALSSHEMRRLDELLRESGVVLYLAGHNHVQEMIQYEGMNYVTTGNAAKKRWWSHQNFDSYHLPSGASRDIVKLYDNNGGFVSLAFTGSDSAELILRDIHGEALQGGSFTIKNTPAPTLVGREAMPTAAHSRACQGVQLQRVNDFCGDFCNVVPDLPIDESCQNYCSSHGLRCKESWWSTEEDLCAVVTPAKCSEEAGSPLHEEDILVCACA